MESGLGEKKLRVLLVEDHAIFREQLVELINRQSDLTIVGQADNATDALQLTQTVTPDILVVDITLKGRSGLELLKDFKAQGVTIPALVLSMHDELLYAERVLRAGARGYITKQEATRNVLLAIRTVLAGDLYLSDKAAMQVASKVATTVPASSRRSFDKLSDRELRVLELIGRGHGTRQIAEMLNLGVPTIETYRARIKDKDGAIYHTYSAYARGDERSLGTYMWLDITPNGRNEGEGGNLTNWVKRHDQYEIARAAE